MLTRNPSRAEVRLDGGGPRNGDLERSSSTGVDASLWALQVRSTLLVVELLVVSACRLAGAIDTEGKIAAVQACQV
jgi:hypothetical protein